MRGSSVIKCYHLSLLYTWKSSCRMKDQKKTETSKKKHIPTRIQKNKASKIKYFPGIHCFLWPLPHFVDKTKHFCGIGPLARKVFPTHRPGNRAFARFLNILWHLGLYAGVSSKAPATLWTSNLSFLMVAVKLMLVLTLFMVGFGLIEAWCGVYLKLV